MSARLAGFVLEKLSAEAVIDGAVVHVRVAGTATHRDVAPLEELFAKVFEACEGRAAGAGAGAGQVAEVVVDLRDVEYMNSSHFKTLVSWVGRVGALERRVAVRMLSNEKYHWQKRSLHALRQLAAGFVSVE